MGRPSQLTEQAVLMGGEGGEAHENVVTEVAQQAEFPSLSLAQKRTVKVPARSGVKVAVCALGVDG